MNKQTKNITSAKKVSLKEYKISAKKTYHISKSDKEHTAYVVKCENYNDIPLELSGAKYEDTNISSARVVDDNDQLNNFVSKGSFDIEEVNIPAGTDRDAFLKKWFKIATKKKTNLLPLLLLPLTACGGAKDVTAPVVAKPVGPVVTEKSTGVWEVGSNNGTIAVTKNTGNTEFTFTPTTGTAVDVAISGVNELQIPTGISVNADAAVVSGKTINGAGTINITNVEDDLDVDLSTITTTNVNATVDSATSIVFGATSHFGDAVVTLTGNTSSTADVITFHSSANLSSATFVVSTGATLGLSLVQAAAISATATITGTGNVVITMPEDTVDNTETALVKIDLEGGSLTFDQGTDDNDILVLKAGSSIDLAGGDLIIDDGIVDFSTNSIIPTNLGSLIMNSGLMMDASVFLNNVSGKISGKGNLILEVSGVDEITALDAKMASYIDSSLDVPTLAVNVGDVSSLNSTQITELNTALTNLAPKLSTVTGKNVAIKDSTGQSIEQFTATVSGGQVKFAGEQKGDISVNVNADGSATFSRGSVKSDTKVTDLSAVDLDVPTSTNLDISLSGNSSQNLFEVNAQNATVIKLKGNIDGTDEITVRINDANSSSLDTKDITIDTTGLSGTGSLVFEFDTTAKNVGKDDTVVLSSSSVISSSIGALEVVNGHLDITKAQIPTGLEVTTASGITMTTAQFISAASFTSLPGSGELTIVADNSTDVASLNNFLTASDTTMTIIGHAITITTDSGDVALSGLSGGYATLKTNLEAISYPGIPQLSDAVTSNDSDISTNLSNLNILTAKVGSITTDNDSTTSTVAVEINAMQDKLLGITGTVVSGIDTEVAALESQLKGTGWNSSNDYANLKTVSDALDALTTNLTTLDTLVGTITDNGGSKTSTVSTELNLLQANVGSLTSTVAEKIAAAVSDLKGTGWDSSNDYANLKTVSDAIDRLDNLVGSITTSNDSTASTVEAEINAIQDQLVGITSVADTVKKVALIPTLSVQGSHLNDSTLHANEGDITIRVSLPSVVAVDDVVHLYLGGVAFTSAKTDTLDSTDISKTYVDFVVTQSQLGSAGAKALSAKIVSGSVTSDTSAGLYFDLSSASTAPTVIPSGISITSATGISGGVLDTGDVVSMAVVFSETVLVTGSPTLTITIGSTDKTATYSSGAGTDTLYFKYTIQSDDGNDDGGISIPTNAITASGSNGITDISGNTATITHTAVSDNSSYKVAIDSVGPSSPLIYTIEGNNYINAAEKTDGVFVAGTTEANATVSIAWGGDTRSVTADAGGDWYAYYGAGDSAIASGTITVTPTDEAGNTGSAATASVTVDTTAPAAVASIALASDTGSSGSDGITSSGTVNVSLNEGTAWQYMVNNGGWVDGSNTSFVLIGDGSKSIKVREIDAAGNVGPSSTLSATLDTSASVGTLSVKNISNGTGSPITTSDTDFNLELSSAEASSTTAYQYKYTNLSDVVVTNWTTTSTQPTIGKDGKYEFRANVTDAAGNTSTSNTVTVNVSATGPTLSSSSITQSDDSSVNSIGETYVLNLTFDKIVNGLTSGTDSTVWRDGDSGVSATWAGSNGTTTRTLTYTVAAGDTGAVTINETNLETVLAAGITDGSGNAFSDSISEIDSGGLDDVDGVVPSAPSNAIDLATGSDSGINNDNKTSDTTPTVRIDLTGTNAVAGDTLELLLGGSSLSSAVTKTLDSTDISNNYVDLTTGEHLGSDGDKVFTAKVTDVAGNVGSAGGSLTVTLDTAAPSAPSNAIDLATGSDSGINNDNKTSDTTPTVRIDLTGTNAVVGDTLELLLGGSSLSSAVTKTLDSTDISNNYVDLTTGEHLGSDGDKVFTAKVTDVAGNVGSAGGSLTVTLDTAAAITIADTVEGDNRVNASEDGHVLVTGTTTGVEDGQTVTVVFTDGSSGTVSKTTTVASNAWTIDGSEADISGLADGTITITANVSDVAGNAASQASKAITLDNATPSAPSNAIDLATGSDSGINNDNKTSDTTPTVRIDLTGTNAVAGDALELLLGGSSLSSAVTKTLDSTDISNNYVDLTTGEHLGSDGDKVFTAKVTDVAGNVGSAGGSLTVTLDTAAPSAPSNAIDLATGSDSGINNDNKTSDTTPTVRIDLTGTNAVVGDTLELLLGGSSLSSAVTKTLDSTDISNNYVDLTTGEHLGSDGDKVFTAKVTDVAGNVGSAGGSLTVTLDTAAAITIADTVEGDNRVNASEDGHVLVTGTTTGVEDGQTVTVVFTDGSSGTVSATTTVASNAWTLTGSEADISGLADGTITITANVSDVAGNAASQASKAITLDNATPSAPSNAIDLATGSDSGINNDNKTSDTTPTVRIDLTGTNAVAGDTLELLLGGSSLSSAVTKTLDSTDITRNYVDLTTGEHLGSDGDKVFTAKVTDVAGNVGSAGGSLTVTLDTAAAITIADTVEGDNRVNASEDGHVLVTGTTTGVEDGQTVTVVFTDGSSGTVSATTTVASNAWTLTGSEADISGLADGTITITANVSDVAGNAASQASKAITLDNATPSAPSNAIDLATGSDSGINNDNKTSDTTPTVRIDLTGTNAVAGDALELLLGGSSLSSAVTKTLDSTDISNNYVDLTTGEHLGSDGDKVFTAKVTDVAGNVGSAGGSLTVTLDTAAPSAPSNAIDLATGSDSGINNDNKTSDTTPTVRIDLTGTNAVVGDTLELLLGGSSLSSAVTKTLDSTDISNNYVDLTTGEHLGSDGDKVFTAKVTDVAGNVGSAGGSLTVTLDTAAAITIADTVEGDNRVNASEDGHVLVTGTTTGVEDGQTVTVVFTDGSSGTVSKTTTVASNAWTLTGSEADISGLADGTITITANVSDVAGNAASQASKAITLDNATPSAPSNAIDLATGSDSGINNDNKTSDTTPTVRIDLTGTNAVAGDALELLLGGSSLSSAVTKTLDSTDISNNYVDLTTGEHLGSDGDKVFTAKVTDVAGNVGSAGGSLTVTLDTAAPSAPSNAIDLATGSDSGINNDNKTSDTTPTVRIDLTGTNAVVGDTLELLLGGSSLSSAVTKTLDSTDISNNYVDLTTGEHLGSDGDKVFTAKVTDVAGNVGSAGGSLTVTLDTAAAITIADTVEGDNRVNASEDGHVLVTGTTTGVEDGQTVTVVFTDGSSGTVSKTTTVASNAWTIDASKADISGLADGTITITANVSDVAGNAASQASKAITLDNATPSAPSNAIDLATGSDSGINNDNKTSDTTPTVRIDLTGTNAVAGDALELLLGGSSLSSAVTKTLDSTDISNNYVDLTTGEHLGSDGDKVFTAKVTDVAGNVGSAGGSLTVTLDTAAPSAPSNAIDLATGSDSGINNDNKTSDTTPTVRIDLTGTNAVVGDTLELLLGGSSLSSAVTKTLDSTDISNNYVDLTTGEHLGSDGDKVFTAKVTDVAGNVGSAGGSLTVTLDTAAAITIADTVEGDNRVNASEDGHVLVTGTTTGVEDGQTVTVVFTDGSSGTVSATTTVASNAWTLTGSEADISGLADGTITITANVSDVAGNAASQASKAITLDNATPSAPSNAIDLATGSDSGINNDNKTSDTTPTVRIDLTGTNAVAGDTLELLLGGSSLSSAVTKTLDSTDISNNYVDLTTGEHLGSDGDKVFTAKVTDVAGNVGSAGGSLTVTLDTAAAITIADTVEGDNRVNASEDGHVLVTGTTTGVEDGQTVTVVFTDGSSGTVSATTTVASNAWTLTGSEADISGLADGTITITANVSDVAGNAASQASKAITLDNATPSAPSNAIDLATGSDSGINNDNKTSDTTPTVRIDLTGTNAVAGDTLELLLGGSSLSSAVTKTLDSTDISNNYVDLTTGEHLGSDGDKVFTAKVTDVAGNVGSAGGSLTVTLDTAAPLAPSIDVITASDTGTNTSDNISADGTPQIRVTFSGANAALGDTVTLYAGSSSVATATLSSTDISNGITLTPSSAIGADGTYSLTAVITDVAGNVGASSSAISYQLDTSNAAPSASVVAVSSSGFTLLASDGDVQPDWNVVTLDSGSVTLNSSVLNNGSNTTFTIGEQSVLSSNELLVNDGVASAVAVNSGSTAVKLNAGTEFNENIGGTDNKVNITYGFGGEDNITGKGEADFLFGGTDGDTLRARGGDDTLSGGTGADTFVFESSGNGLDTITDFDDTQSDVLDLDAIITGGLYNSGTAVDATANNAIDLANVDNKFVYFEVSDVSSATINETSLFGGSLDFAAEGTSAIEFVLAVGEGSGTDGVKLYQVNDGTGSNDMAITQIALIENNSLADILNANLDVA